MLIVLPPLAVAADMLLTLYIVRTYGIDEESNPLIRRWVGRFGEKALLIPIVAAVLGSVLVHRIFGGPALFALAAVCVVPVVWNSGYIVLRHLRG